MTVGDSGRGSAAWSSELLVVEVVAIGSLGSLVEVGC
jgi:hypothetical protein